MQNIKKLLSLLLLSALLVSCTDSGGGSDNGGGSSDNGLSTNACSSLNLGTRIVNGTECSENNSPVVELQLLLPDGREGTCTGNMISSQDVLTAAHCFFDRPIRVTVNVAGLREEASRVISHPNVTIDESTGFVENDVAIVKLAVPFNLPSLPILVSRAPVSGEEIQIFGYGVTEDQTSSNNTTGVLRSGEMKISKVNSSFVEADFNGQGSNTCSGDSGGPALLKVNTQIAIIGLLSTGDILECTRGDTSRFTNTQKQSVIDFIIANAPRVRLI
jgi:secreted trypsin-like serine protease